MKRSLLTVLGLALVLAFTSGVLAKDEKKAETKKQKIGDILLSDGKISETDMKRTEAFVLGIPFISLTNQKIDFSVLPSYCRVDSIRPDTRPTASNRPRVGSGGIHCISGGCQPEVLSAPEEIELCVWRIQNHSTKTFVGTQVDKTDVSEN